MNFRVGFDLSYTCAQPTPMLLMLNTHFSHAHETVVPDVLVTDPPLPVHTYRDGFGNLCSRIVAPAGQLALRTSALLNLLGEMERRDEPAWGHPVEQLPDDTLVFLLGSRYCETDLLVHAAWQRFGGSAPGRDTVLNICDFVHRHISFDYDHARPTKTAWDVYRERRGVCRDFAHLGIALCRAMNIPARYCTGYVSDVGLPPVTAPMDFAGWFQAYVGGSWQTFDPRNNAPRIGRVLMACGRDAADVAISNAFGAAELTHFEVHCDRA
ncbi:transglutaminase-like domain-containing protein [Burkholderia gladioli]|uniref:transglutaminase-like domain-containing protein n=1 Tax=Burkholderia gladioli TaxID=28095 RepID=UPI001640C66D|nr:transglutaminase family protein [Burkholderia gladioli]